MPADFVPGMGMFTRTPSWHRLEKAVLTEAPQTWEEAMTAAGLFEVERADIYRELVTVDDRGGLTDMRIHIPDHFAILRSDLPIESPEALLGIQPTSYVMIPVASFGATIMKVLDIPDFAGDVSIEALFALYGGRQVICLMKFATPINISGDPSEHYQYIYFSIRFDGNGGLRGVPTSIRVQCANTQKSAEMTDGRKVGFTIRHTSNWEERIQQMALAMAAARQEGVQWQKLASQMAQVAVTAGQEDRFIKRLLPVSDDMTERGRNSVQDARRSVFINYNGPNCVGIKGTVYGLAMAATEYADHGRRHNSPDSYVGRQLLTKEPLKAHAFAIARSMAKVK